MDKFKESDKRRRAGQPGRPGQPRTNSADESFWPGASGHPRKDPYKRREASPERMRPAPPGRAGLKYAGASVRRGAAASGRRASGRNIMPFDGGVIGFAEVRLRAAYERAADAAMYGRYSRAALIAAGVFIVLLIAVFFMTNHNAYQVSLDDKPVGYIAYDKKLTPGDLQKSAADAIAQTSGTEVKPLQTVRLTKVHASGSDMQTRDSIVTAITKSLAYQIQGGQITVDGKPVAMLGSPASADDVLNQVKNSFAATGDNITNQVFSFVEDVQVVPTFIDPGSSISAQDAVKILKSTSPSQMDYTVVSGDNPSKIAARYNMNLNEFMTLNGFSGSPKLSIGQMVKLSVQKPTVSVKDVVTQVYTDTAPKNVVNQQNPNEPVGYTKVIQQGQDGQRTITAQITYINGVQTNKTQSDAVTIQPVDEIVEVGTAK